jgi:hypothetical protein
MTDLPANGNLLSLLDVMLADVIGDRLDTGGLSTGEALRIGAHGSSWTQTTYRVGDIDITDPDGSGTPLLLPGVLEWDRVDVSTGVMPPGINAPGLAISLTPRRPGNTWTRSVEFFGGPRPFVGGAPGYKSPAMARLRSYGAANLLLSGPLLSDRLGATLAATWTSASRFERNDPTRLSSSLGSLFAHFVYTPNGRDELRATAWHQKANIPFTNRVAVGQPEAEQADTSLHTQIGWDRRTSPNLLWTTFAGYTRRHRSPDLKPPTSIAIERLTDGPPSALLYPGRGTDATWTLGARLQPTLLNRGPMSHTLQGGVEVGGSAVRVAPSFTGLIGESVEGLPARVWSYSATTADSRWRDQHFSVYVNDRLQLTPKLQIEGGLRFEAILGSSPSNDQKISWKDLLPRGGLRVEIVEWGHIAAFVNYTRTAHRLPLTNLAWGDRTAPSGTVYRWNTTSPARSPQISEIGMPIQQIGPGPGTLGLTSIDPELKRPRMDEMVFGFEARPSPSTVIRFAPMASRQRQLVGVVDTLPVSSSYSIFSVPDDNVDVVGSEDDRMLRMFNRNLGSFGLDRYVLTNPEQIEATLVGVDLTGQATTERLFLIAGFTASRSEGYAGNIGFRTMENDIGVLGDVFINPNSRDHAQGRLFTERGYTFKAAAAYRFSDDFRGGIAARYQDGQHFARLVLAPDMNQGPELVRAFRNGRTRFTFTMTIDMRLQKDFLVGPYRMTALLDVYNLFNQGLEVEEYSMTGPASRSTTAIQPPRAIHLGGRLRF